MQLEIFCNKIVRGEGRFERTQARAGICCIKILTTPSGQALRPIALTCDLVFLLTHLMTSEKEQLRMVCLEEERVLIVVVPRGRVVSKAAKICFVLCS